MIPESRNSVDMGCEMRAPVRPPKDFGWALNKLCAGLKVFRQDWNGKGMYLSLQMPDDNSKMSRPYIYIRTAKNDLVPWVASHGDLLNSDWEVFK